jgi:hypothetical protein
LAPRKDVTTQLKSSMNPIRSILIKGNPGCFDSTGIGLTAIPRDFADDGERNKFFEALLNFRTVREKVYKIPMKASVL